MILKLALEKCDFNSCSNCIGNDFNGINIKKSGIIDRVKEQSYPFTVKDDIFVLKSPDGYTFYVTDSAGQSDVDPVQSVIINSNDLQKTQSYWTGLLEIKLVERSDKEIRLTYGEKQAELIFKKTGILSVNFRGVETLKFHIYSKFSWIKIQLQLIHLI